MITAVIQIGNSDNTLTEAKWAKYSIAMWCAIDLCIERYHFRGGSTWDAFHQTALWVCEVDPDKVQKLRNALEKVRREFHQDSVALTLGNTEFV